MGLATVIIEDGTTKWTAQSSIWNTATYCTRRLSA